MPITTPEKLRLLNLAYNHMQGDFKRIFPELFRGDAQTLTTDANGYIYLDPSTFEIEQIVKSGSKESVGPMDKKNKYESTGWYVDGAQTSGTGAGKLRIQFRNSGAPWTSTTFVVDALREYPELDALDDIPYPFVQQRYLNMLTELQAFMLYTEGGKESAGQAEKHWNIYQFLLKEAKKDRLHQLPQFMAEAHPDAGDGRGGHRTLT